MKRLILICALALPLGGCNVAALLQNTADVAQEAREIAAQIRAGVKVAATILDARIVALCSRVPEIASGAREVKTIFINPGPRTRQLLADADDALSRTGAACASYTGNGSASTFVKLAAAFEVGRQSVAAASAGGGT